MGVQTPLSKASRVTFKSPVGSDFASPVRSSARATSVTRRSPHPRSSVRDSSAFDFGTLWSGGEELSAMQATSPTTQSNSPQVRGQTLHSFLVK